ncbi:MAG TPA: hypothetical protein DCY89_06095 [Gammaproteobacteria bacterium]|nr:hypothetical protein [Gammaproteobacteria bacterium]
MPWRPVVTTSIDAAGVLAVVLLATLTPAAAAGIEDRYRAECFACHGEEAYAEAKRRIKSHAALLARVRACTRVVGGEWSEAEIETLVELLDARFYHLR